MMEKLIAGFLLLTVSLTTIGQTNVENFVYPTPSLQMEKLDRGLVVVPAKSGNGYFLSWRMYGTDPLTTRYDIYRDGSKIKYDLVSTNTTDTYGAATSQYMVVAKVDGQEVDSSKAVTPWDDICKSIKLNCPKPYMVTDSLYCHYLPGDCSVGDVDGDGEYELFVEWAPSASRDNGQGGYAGMVYIDCYKLDGTKLWRVNLGKNIRAGAHYTQFMVYDFDGDGKAEMICKTAPGTIDGAGNFVSQAADDASIRSCIDKADYRNGGGFILAGPEFLTVFNGQTGAAVNTVYYNPNRGFGVGGSAKWSSAWGDGYGNRGDRYLATVAYLDGPDKNPSAVMCRGYYTLAYLWAVNFDGKKLSTKWLHASFSKDSVAVTDAQGNMTKKGYKTNTSGLGSYHTAYACGNHNLSCGDVDGDGCDEIIYGSCAIDNDGQLLYSTGLGHGDAMHLGDLDPDRPGLEVFTVHEEGVGGVSWDLHDAKTGEILKSDTGSGDNGRGMAADVISSNRGYEMWSATDPSVRSTTGEQIGSLRCGSYCFRLYWNGDLQDELLNGTRLDGYAGTSYGRILTTSDYHCYSINGTKATPNLGADILGDWREELVMCRDSATLNILTTNIPTFYRVPTLMHDHVYRLGVAWQNVAYNQPPHLGYYLPDYIKYQQSILTDIQEVATEKETYTPIKIFDLQGRQVTNPTRGIYIENGKKIIVR